MNKTEEIKRMADRIAKLEAALRFYADRSPKDYAAALREHVDIGQRARTALKE